MNLKDENGNETLHDGNSDIVDADKYYDKDIKTIKELIKVSKAPEIPTYEDIMAKELAAERKELVDLRKKQAEIDITFKEYEEKIKKQNDAAREAGKNSWQKAREYLLNNLKLTSLQKNYLENDVISNETLVNFEKMRLTDERQRDYPKTWMKKSDIAGIVNPGSNARVVFTCENGFWGFYDGYWKDDADEHYKYYEYEYVGNNVKNTVPVNKTNKAFLFLFKESTNQDKTQCEEPEPVEPEPVAADAVIAKEPEKPVTAQGGKKEKTKKKEKTMRRKRQ